MNTNTGNQFFKVLLLAIAAIQLVACKPTAPEFTSADNAVFTEGSLGLFIVTATGTPTPTVSLTGTLPSGVSFVDATGTLYGTPAVGSSGTYPLTITATNGSSSSATQDFTLTVIAASAPPTTPVFTSANNAVFTEETVGIHIVTATGTPEPTFSLTGSLPTGVSFAESTGTLYGEPIAGSSGIYPLTITAKNGSTAIQNFTLAVVTASTEALIVHDGTAGIEANVVTNLTTKMTTAGLTVTANVGVPAGDLSGYAQIWDVRFNNTTPLSAGDITSYTAYLASGRTLAVIGENAGFATRNDSIVSFISSLGGGTITLSTPDNAQTVQAPFNGPNEVSAITLFAGAGTTDPGTGAFITKDSNNNGMGFYYARGNMGSAPCGMLMVVFDINFLDLMADAASQSLVNNMIVIP